MDNHKNTQFWGPSGRKSCNVQNNHRSEGVSVWWRYFLLHQSTRYRQWHWHLSGQRKWGEFVRFMLWIFCAAEIYRLCLKLIKTWSYHIATSQDPDNQAAPIFLLHEVLALWELAVIFWWFLIRQSDFVSLAVSLSRNKGKTALWPQKGWPLMQIVCHSSPRTWIYRRYYRWVPLNLKWTYRVKFFELTEFWNKQADKHMGDRSVILRFL